jgi:hypothetical protein
MDVDVPQVFKEKLKEKFEESFKKLESKLESDISFLESLKLSYCQLGIV